MTASLNGVNKTKLGGLEPSLARRGTYVARWDHFSASAQGAWCQGRDRVLRFSEALLSQHGPYHEPARSVTGPSITCGLRTTPLS